IEVARLAPGPSLQEVELVDRLSVTSLRRALLMLGSGVVIDGASGGLTLLFRSTEEGTPAIKGPVEAPDRAGDDLLREGLASHLVPGRSFWRQVLVKQREHPLYPAVRLRRRSGLR